MDKNSTSRRSRKIHAQTALGAMINFHLPGKSDKSSTRLDLSGWTCPRLAGRKKWKPSLASYRVTRYSGVVYESSFQVPLLADFADDSGCHNPFRSTVRESQKGNRNDAQAMGNEFHKPPSNLRRDGTNGASKKPDPNRVFMDGVLYRLAKKGKSP